MTNPAVLAGLIAGYTVGAVVTALAVAHDDRPAGPVLAPASPWRRSGACMRLGRGRSAARCLHSFESSPSLSSPRR